MAKHKKIPSKITKITLERCDEGYGLRAKHGWTYAMLGKKWGVSRARARAIVGPVRKFQAVM